MIKGLFSGALVLVSSLASAAPAASPGHTAHVFDASQLVAATHNLRTSRIVVHRSLEGLASLALLPGQRLIGQAAGITLSFRPGEDGVRTSTDSHLERLILVTSPERRAVYNDDQVASLGSVLLQDISTVGQVQFVARRELKAGRIQARNVHVRFADSTAQPERPGTGVVGDVVKNIDIEQGAFTVLNLQEDRDSLLEVDLRDIAIGSEQQPVYGSGILLSSGKGNIHTHPGQMLGGQVRVTALETGDVFNDSRLPEGTSNKISGSVFVAYAQADLVVNRGRTVSYGVNGLGLDNWGTTRNWTSIGPVTTHGTSGMGVVSFGMLEHLSVASVETFGNGARAYNVLTGTVQNTYFGWLRTHGNGASAILLTQPVGHLSVNGNIETSGGSAGSLVKGVIYQQPSSGVWLKDGSAQQIFVGGKIITRGSDNPPVLLQNSQVGRLVLGGVPMPANTGAVKPL